MLKGVFFAAAGLLLSAHLSSGQSSSGNPSVVELANLREDMRLLTQRVGELQLRLEQVERENSELRAKSASTAQAYATVQQLNESVADLNRAIKSSAAATKTETLQQVSVQMEKLGKQMNAALDTLSKNSTAAHAASSPVTSAPASFSDDYPKEGIKYTVQKGDSLVSIAKKTGAKTKDILNANKLADASKIQVGQTLFIPGGK